MGFMNQFGPKLMAGAAQPAGAQAGPAPQNMWGQMAAQQPPAPAAPAAQMTGQPPTPGAAPAAPATTPPPPITPQPAAQQAQPHIKTSYGPMGAPGGDAAADNQMNAMQQQQRNAMAPKSAGRFGKFGGSTARMTAKVGSSRGNMGSMEQQQQRNMQKKKAGGGLMGNVGRMF